MILNTTLAILVVAIITAFIVGGLVVYKTAALYAAII